METKNIVNLLNSSENEYSKFATKNGMLLTENQKVFVQKIIQQSFYEKVVTRTIAATSDEPVTK